MAIFNRETRRRGVLLLVVLSMLTLFLLLGTAFVVLAARARSTSKAFRKLAESQAQPMTTWRPLLHDAALQVIRGSNISPIGRHDLLGDKYGGASQPFPVQNFSLVAANQLLQLVIPTPPDGPLSLCGRVLTFVDGPEGVAGTTTRVVQAAEVAGNPSRSRVYVLRPKLLPSPINPAITTVRINEPEFAGRGFSSPQPSLPPPPRNEPDLTDRAFKPNARFDSLTGDPPPQGGNEDYDAVDEQNMALASPDGYTASFHRQEIVNHWIARYARASNATDFNAAADDLAELLHDQYPGGGSVTQAQAEALVGLRQAMLRPFPFDHVEDDQGRAYDFTGRPLQGTGLAALAGNDVDTDGDGILDSVWLDLGQPARPMPDGTSVKPLFAIRCVDLQGRLNVNVHGSPTHALAAAAPPADPDPRLAKPRTAVNPAKDTPLPIGQGFGAADVRVDTLLGPDLSQVAVVGLQNPQGRVSGMERNLGPVFGRYGDEVGSGTTLPRPGRPNINDFRTASDGKALDRRLWRGPRLKEGFDYWARNPQPANRTGYAGSPPDFWSRYAIGMDHRGHPLAINRVPDLTVDEMIDNPYEFDPASFPNPHGGVVTTDNRWIDQPFTPAEFEALLRPFDADNSAALPQRMIAMMVAAAAGSSADFAYIRNAVTAMSWDTPLVVVRGSDAPAWDPGSPHFDSSKDRRRYDWDLIRGLKMDLNRPFGDGVDNDGNGAVDDASETNRPDETERPNGSDEYAIPVDGDGRGWHLTRGLLPQEFLDLDQPGPNVATLRARQLYAFHLFNLLKSLEQTYAFLFPGPAASAMTDPGSRLFAIDTDDADTDTAEQTQPPKAIDAALASNVQNQQAHTDRVLAQWAINIVDFLDADAIMTPFRYRAGGPSPTRHVVWGCEYPDLMITETLAFHDRGIADTDKDDGPKTTTTHPMRPDPTLDQVRLPQGSLFIELHATRNPNTPNPPAELYRFENGSWLLDVGRTVPPNDLGWTAPVWRLSIARREGTGLRNDPFQMLAKYPDTEWLMPHGGSQIGGDTVVAKQGTDANAAIQPERYVWLTPQAPPSEASATINGDSGFPHLDNTFRIRNGPSPLVARGGYLVIGPRVTTPLGSVASTVPGVGGAPATSQYGVPSPQQIQLRPNASVVDVISLAGQRTRASTAVAIVTADPPTTPANWNPDNPGIAQTGIGLSVSEPLRNNYYREPTTLNEARGVYDLFDPENLPDTPFDEAGTRPLVGSPDEGTASNFATVILERLADPLRPHDPRPEISGKANPAWNPYIPLDMQPVDLTVFRGESPSDAAFRFYTRQRGFGSELAGFNNDAVGTGQGQIARNANPWKPLGSAADLDLENVHPRPTEANTTANTQAHFDHELNQLQRSTPADWNEIPYHSLGWLNSSYGRRLGPGEAPDEYVGSPDAPFPSITWNDRPFANAYELLLVPRTAPSRLFTNFRPLDLTQVPGAVPPPPQAPAPGAPPPQPNPYASATLPDDVFGAQTPGAHLFPLTPLTDRPIAGGRYSRNADVFGRIFEFVRVPCPFACATVAIEPDGWTAQADDPEAFFKAPFNQIPLYREPGGVNLNTIPRATPANPDPAGMNEIGERIWAALRGETIPENDLPPAPAFTPAPQGSPSRPNLTDARDVSAGGSQVALPFRAMRGTRHDLTAGSAAANTFLPLGLFPNFASLDGELAPRNFTLFGDAIGEAASLFTPVLHPDPDAPGSDPSRDPRLHPWFGFQPLIRAAAASTVRSETYAIWVTMGLFEVQKSPAYTWYAPDGSQTSVAAGATGSNNPIFPLDGLRLVREYGGDTGEITRYRAFYLYDRSIPVQYEPGANTNVERGILLERFVE